MKLGLLIFFAANTLAAPFLELDKDLPKAEVKSLGCKASRFSRGQTYTYDYEGETMNTVEGATTHKTGLKIKATIKIQPLGECKFSMELSNAKLLHKRMGEEKFEKSDDSGAFKKAMEKYDLFFHMTGNQITGLFSNKEEDVYILNNKRGILSAMQVDEDVTTETDVNGVCKTSVTVRDGKILKEKILSDCTERATQEIGIQASSIKSESNLKVLDSKSKCVYTMKGDNIKKIDCEEMHLFRPFSAGFKTPSGAMTTVKQTVTLAGVKSLGKQVRSFNGGNKEETTLLFDHANEEGQATKSMSGEFEQVMQQLVKPSAMGSLSAKQDSAHEFSALVFLLRKMDGKRMKQVWDKFYDCEISQMCGGSDSMLKEVYRQYLLDGIAYCGTTTCISTVRDVIISGEITGERMNIFLQSIALVGKTNKKMIRDIIGIIKKYPTRQAYLTLGTVLYRHCEKYPGECDDDKNSPITQAEDFLTGKLGQACRGQDDYKELEEILMAMKAIANAKRPVRAAQVIIRCATKSVHTNLTRAAFDALKNLPCDDKVVDALYHFTRDTENDPEKRISSFVALMSCPSEVILDHMVHLLKKEPSNQLASFIWSYLTNIIESSNPKHRRTQEMLAKITKETPLRNVDLPLHQFSRAYEKSVHIENTGGATAEGHVLFDRHSMFPKTAFFELTAHILNVPVPLLETNLGLEGMEDLIEKAVGDDGIISKENWLVNIFNVTVTAQKLREMAQQQREKTSKRFRRATVDIDDNISELHEKVNKMRKQPNGYLTFKVMGQEIRTFSYDDIFNMIEEIDNMNVIQLLLNVAKGGKKTFTKSMMFLEMSQNVPTGLGLPLKLKLVGSTVASIEFTGKFDIRNMFWGRGQMEVKGSVTPSAVVEISGQMGVDGHFISSGMYVNSSMFVSNQMSGQVVYKEGKLFNIQLDAPKEPVELFKVGSTPFMYLNSEVKAIEGLGRKINTDEKCIKSELIGYGLCMKFQMPVAFREYEAPYFPLSGPSGFELKMIRADEKLSFYQFLINFQKKQSATTGSIEFSTPGATYDRTLSGDFSYTVMDIYRTLKVSTKRFGSEASILVKYDTLTHTTEITGTNNMFTTKDIITKVVFFNTTSKSSNKQFGVRFSTEYDWYKFEHVSKVVQKPTGYMMTSTTQYYPDKSITGVVEYNTAARKLSTRFDVIGKSYEISGKYVTDKMEKGVRLTAECLTTGVSSSVYTGIMNGDETLALITSAIGFDNTVKNVLSYNVVTDKRSIINTLTINGNPSNLRAYLTRKASGSSLVFGADISGKTVGTVEFGVLGSSELIMFADIAGKTAKAALAYSEGPSVNAKIDIMGKKASGFVTLSGTTFVVGGDAGKYVAGLKGVYTKPQGHVQSVCTSVYYGTSEDKVEPVEVCASFHSLGKDFIHKKVSLLVDLKSINKNAEFVVNYEQHIGHIKTLSEVKFNGQQLYQEKFQIKYNDLFDSEVSYDCVINKEYTYGMKLFSKNEGTEQQVGFEGNVMGKSVALVNKYTNKNNNMQMKMEISVNGDVLPVSTELSYLNSNTVKGPTMKIFVGDYSVGYTHTVTKLSNNYEWGVKVFANKGSDNLITLFKATGINFKPKSKSFKQKFGAIVLNTPYEYGWETEYKNLGSEMKSAHAVTFRLHYSTQRSSAITFTVSDDKSEASFKIDAEYLPSKTLKHALVYSKPTKQMNVDIEFLPKMHIKLMTRLENDQLVTHIEYKTKQFKKSLQVTYGFKNTDEAITLSTTFGKDISFSVGLTKATPRSIEVKSQVYGAKNEWELVLSTNEIQNKIMSNGKLLFKMGADYYPSTETASLAFANGKERLLSLTSDIGDLKKTMVQRLTALKKLVKVDGSIGDNQVFFTLGGEKQWIEFLGKINRNEKTITSYLSVMGKKQIAVEMKMLKSSVSMTVTPSFMKAVTFKAAFDSNIKQVKFSGISDNRKIGIMLRADLKNKITSALVFCNKNIAGLEVFVEGKALVTRISLTHKLGVQTSFKIEDKTLDVTVQNIINGKATKQSTFKYKLTEGLSQLSFDYNTKTIEEFYQTVTDFLEMLMKDGAIYSAKAYDSTKQFYTKTQGDARKASLELADNLIKSFKEIDFVGVKNTIKSKLVIAMNKLSELIKITMELAINNIDKVKSRIPELTHKFKQLVMKIKGLEFNTKNTIEQIKNLMKEMNINLESKLVDIKQSMAYIKKNADDISFIVSKVVANVTESSKPVFKTAFKLLKEFKVQGKSTEEILTLLQSKLQTIFEAYSKDAEVQFQLLKTNTIEMYNELLANLLNSKVPCCDKTVQQMIDMIIVKITELKQTVEVNSLKLKKMLDEVDIPGIKELVNKLKLNLMNFEIKGKSIKKHIVLLRKDMNKLPLHTRALIEKLYELVEKLNGLTTKVIEDVLEFSKPLTKHIKFVKKSVNKHFGPILTKSMKRIVKNIPEMDVEVTKAYLIKQWKIIEAFFKPLLEPLGPLYTNMIRQIENIKINGFRLGPLVKLQMQMINEAAQKYMKVVKTNLDTNMKTLKKAVNEITIMTSDELINKFYDISTVTTDAAKQYLTKTMEEKVKILKELMAKIEALYNQLNEQYSTFTKQDFDEIMETFIHKSSENIIGTAEKLSEQLKEISKIDLSAVTLKAWKEADLVNKFKNAELNDKIKNIIKKTMKIDVGKISMQTYEKIQKFIADLYAQVFLRSVRFYNKMEKSVNYIRSMPTQDYEQWMKDLKTVALKYNKQMMDFAKTVINTENKEQIIKFITKVYNLATKEEIVDFVTKTYQVNRKTVEKLYQSSMKMSDIYLEKVVSDYVKPAKQWAMLINEKSQNVYSDIKQPSIDVFNHYNVIVSKFVSENYDVIEAEIMERYTTVSKKVSVQIEALKVKLNNLLTKIYEVQTQLLNKYGDMTWEMIGEEAYEYTRIATKDIRKTIRKSYKKLLKLQEVYVKKATAFYKKSLAIYEEYLETIEKDLKPKALKMLKEYKTTAEQKFELIKEMIYAIKAKIEFQLDMLKAKTVSMYNTHKDKPLRKLYNDAKIILSTELDKQMVLFKTEFTKASNMMKSSAFATSKLAKAIIIDYLTKADVLVRTVVIPELKAEGESLINQTLRASVVLTNEAIVAFTPHFNVLKELTQAIVLSMRDLSADMQTKVMELAQKIAAENLVILRENVNKIWKILSEMLTKLQEHEMYKNTVNHEYVVKSKAKLNEYIELTKAKFEELKSHPTTQVYKAKVEEIVKYIKMYLNDLEALYKRVSKNTDFTKINALVKQIQTSSLFTLDKLSNSVLPHFKAVMVIIESKMDFTLPAISDLVNEFRSNPEEAFWTWCSLAKEATKDIVSILMNVDMQVIKDTIKVDFELINIATDFIFEDIFDEWTKSTFKYGINTVQDILMKALEEIKKLSVDVNAWIEEMKSLKSLEWKKMMENVQQKVDSMTVSVLQKKVELMKSLNENMNVLNKWIKEQMNYINKEWKQDPIHEMLVNPIWNELYEEFMNHEIVEAGQVLSGMTGDNYIDLKDKAFDSFTIRKLKLTQQMKEIKQKLEGKYTPELKAKYAEMLQKYNKMVERYSQMKNKYADLMQGKLSEMKEKYSELKEKYSKVEIQAFEKYTELIEMYKSQVKKYTQKYYELFSMTEKFLDETTLADIVNFVMKKRDEGIAKFQATKLMLTKMKDKYVVQLMAIMETYKATVMDLYKNYPENVLKMYENYSIELLDLYKNMYGKSMEMYTSYKSKVLALYNKYSEKALQLFVTYSERSMQMYRLYSEQYLTMLKDYKNQMMPYYNKYEANVVQLYGKVMQIIVEYRTQMIPYYSKYEAQFMKVFTQYYDKLEAQFTVLQMKLAPWIELSQAKAMNVLRISKDLYKNLVDNYIALYKIIVEKYEEYYNTAQTQYINMKDIQYDQVYANGEAKYNEMKPKIMKLVKNYQKDALKTVKKLKNCEFVKNIVKFIKSLKEITVKDTFDMLKKVPTEAQRLANIAFDKVSEITVLYDTFIKDTQKLVNEYRQMTMIELTNKYKEVVEKFGQKYNLLYTQAVEKYSKLYDLVMKNYNNMYDIASERYYQLINKALERVNEIYAQSVTMYNSMIEMTLLRLKEGHELLRPTIFYQTSVLVGTEIMETADFIVKYYDLTGKYNSMVTYAVATYETVRIAKEYQLEAIRLIKKYKQKAITHGKAYKNLIKKLSVEYQKIAYEMVQQGYKSGVKYVKNIDMKKVQEQIKKMVDIYMKKLNKYVKIDMKNGKFNIDLPHVNMKKQMKDIKQRVRRNIATITEQGKIARKQVEQKLSELKTKANELKSQLKKQMMKKTSELRADLQTSIDVNSKLLRSAIEKGKVMKDRVYVLAMKKLNLLKEKISKLMISADKLQKVMFEKMIVEYRKLYTQASALLTRFYESPVETLTALYNHALVKISEGRSKVMKFYKQNKPVVMRKMNKQRTLFLSNAKQMSTKMMKKTKEASLIIKAKAKYVSKMIVLGYSTIESAFKQWRSGVPAEKAFYAVIRQVKFITEYFTYDYFTCKHYPEVCVSFNTHKYIDDISATVVSSELRMMRNVRRVLRTMRMTKEKLIGASYPASAMIYGANHVVTFDKKSYDFVEYTKRDCTYMLAHDFVNNKFSVMSQKDAIIIKTKDMKIIIKSDGKTVTTIGEKSTKSLPVESGSNTCFRYSNLIKCEFAAQGLFVKVDLTNFLTTIQLSSWNRGKTQGILGTFNGETFDEMTLPNGKITTDVYKFANAYEMTKKRACVVTKKTKKVCKRAASPKCKELLESESSIYAQFFDILDPKPFLKACMDDTSACKPVGHCSSVAAYSTMLMALGERSTQFCPGCVKIGTHKLGDEWTQSATGEVDVVVMVSQKETKVSFKKQLMKILIQLQQKMRMNKYNARYALIGFGGTGVHEYAHMHPIGTGDDIFGNMNDLTKEIKGMSFTGDEDRSNDAFEALVMASRLAFRPGSSRVFILHTKEEIKSSVVGYTAFEAKHFVKNEANASLFIFQDFENRVELLKSKFIGETSQKTYTKRAPAGVPKIKDMTTSVFKDMTEYTHGGLFTTEPSSLRHATKSLFDAMLFNIRRVNLQCQSCVVRAKWSGFPKAACTSRNDIRC